MTFTDRRDAGRRLAAILAPAPPDAVVVGLPRGGVVVAFEVARTLGVPLDVILVRKLGVPSQPELAMGAIGEGGVRVLNPDTLRAAGIGASELTAVEEHEQLELDRRAAAYRGSRPKVDLSRRPVYVVDDGIATGATARAACAVAKAEGAERVVMAVPVAPADAVGNFADLGCELVAVHYPNHFYAIGQWYDDFSPTSDEEVVRLLSAAGPPV